MAVLTVQNIVRSGNGLNPTYAAAAGGGDTFAPGPATFLQIKNGSGSAITVTVVTPNALLDGVLLADIVVSVPATSGDKMLGPFPAEHFADPSDGLVHVTYSGVTSLTVGAIKLSQP